MPVLLMLFVLQFFLKASASSGTSDGTEDGKMTIKKGKDGWKIDFSGEKPATPVLDTVNYPAHMKNLSIHVYHPEFLCNDIQRAVVFLFSHISLALKMIDGV